MGTAILYVSLHHGNTRKLAEAISEECGIRVIDGMKEKDLDLEDFDRIGFAAGIAFGKFYPQMLRIMEEKLPEGKEVFFLYTYGAKMPGYSRAARKIAEGKNARILGEYGCRGYDTYGPFKLIGGVAKGRPNETDIEKAVAFYRSLL
ncbi:MAG: flavodoxin family protein [Christensenellales bacterium]|jgi:flavodoxin